MLPQIEFQTKKIEELQKQMDDSQRFFDDKISKYLSMDPNANIIIIIIPGSPV